MTATLTPQDEFTHADGTAVCRIPGCGDQFPFPSVATRDAHEADHATAKVAAAFGETIEVRPSGFTTVANGFGGTTTVRTTPVVPPTEKQTKFVRSLLAERAGVPEAEDIRRMLNTHREAGTLSKSVVSKAIDALLQIARPAAAPTEVETPKAFDPSKGSLGREVLEAIPAGRYYVDGTFLKVDRPDNGRWAGFIFVKLIRNISGSFEDVRRVAILNPEASSARVDEGHRLAVETLAADPKAAAIAFGKHTGSCCICGRTLTDPASVEAGIGPICAGKF